MTFTRATLGVEKLDIASSKSLLTDYFDYLDD